MIDRLRRMMPTQEAVQRNRWLRWMGPRLLHPQLWTFHRRNVARGVAIGVFFAFLIPIAQIPLSAAFSILLRANLPTAAVATIVNNPLTFPPVYYAAWELGRWMLHWFTPGDTPATPPDFGGEGDVGYWLALMARQLDTIGAPLALGSLTFACVFSAIACALVHWVWIHRVRSRRKLRAGGLSERRP